MEKSNLIIEWPKEIEIIKNFLEHLRENVSRPESLLDKIKNKIDTNIKVFESQIRDLRADAHFNENDLIYKKLLKDLEINENAKHNLQFDKYIKEIRIKEREMESRNYFIIKNATEMQKQCLECSKLIKNANWKELDIVFENQKEIIKQQLLIFFQEMYKKIDEQKGIIHYKVENYFENTIRNFLFLLVRHAKIFKHDVDKEKKVTINPYELIGSLESKELNKLIKQNLDLKRYIDHLDNKKLYDFTYNAFDKLTEEERGIILKNYFIDIKITPYFIMALIQNLSDDDKDILSHQISEFLYFKKQKA